MDLEDLLMSDESIKKLKAPKDAVFLLWNDFIKKNASETQRAEYALKYNLFLKTCH